MMQLPLSNYLAVPLLVMLVFLGACSLYYTVLTSRSRRKGRKRIYRCDGCKHVYAEARHMPMAQCPRCGKTNESIRT